MQSHVGFHPLQKKVMSNRKWNEFLYVFWSHCNPCEALTVDEIISDLKQNQREWTLSVGIVVKLMNYKEFFSLNNFWRISISWCLLFIFFKSLNFSFELYKYLLYCQTNVFTSAFWLAIIPSMRWWAMDYLRTYPYTDIDKWIFGCV